MARTDSVAVPQFEAAERHRVVLKSDLVDEHVRRGDHPWKIARPHITHMAYEVACTRMIPMLPVLRTSKVSDFPITYIFTK